MTAPLQTTPGAARAARTALGLTQEELAAAMGVTARTVQNAESVRGPSRLYMLGMRAIRLEAAFGIAAAAIGDG